MAKKKRKHRRPVAPPVHSAPEVAHPPAGPRPVEPPQARPFAPEPPATSFEPDPHGPAAASLRTRDAARRRQTARKRRSRLRTYAMIAGVVVLLVGAFVARSMLSSRAARQFDELALASGCGKVQDTGGSGGQDHLRPGQTARYDTSPPTHGAHDPQPLRAGVHKRPLNETRDEPSIFQAVHSLEHGYIIVWYDRLTKAQIRDLEQSYGNERKVIIAPYPKLVRPNEVAVTAWGKLLYCQKPNNKVIDGFTDRFREARTAPEPKGA